MTGNDSRCQAYVQAVGEISTTEGSEGVNECELLFLDSWLSRREIGSK